MKSPGLLLLLSCVGGCFFVEPINQRPSLGILPGSSEAVERGQKDVVLEAAVDDPEGHLVNIEWRMYVCDDATEFSTCDPTATEGEFDRMFVFDAPIARLDGSPALSLLIELDGTDDLGAVARPAQQLVIPLKNGKPTIETSQSSEYGKTIGTPIDVFAVYDDADDTAANVTLSFTLHPPGASTQALVDVCPLLPNGVCPDPGMGRLQDGRRFVPDLVGEWKVEVIASDPLGGDDGSTTVLEKIFVVEDQLPCLGVVSPQPPTGTNQLPVSEPTLFQVHQVIDALDPFPTNLNDTTLGQSAFHWSIKVNTGARQTLATETGNSLAFDPASFAADDVVEVRVEIEDRLSPFPLTCDPVDPTCQLDPTTTPACLQRQTWKVKVQ